MCVCVTDSGFSPDALKVLERFLRFGPGGTRTDVLPASTGGDASTVAPSTTGTGENPSGRRARCVFTVLRSAESRRRNDQKNGEKDESRRDRRGQPIFFIDVFDKSRQSSKMQLIQPVQ